MTIREFAALCNLSPATVSRCFSGQGSVGEEARNKIEEMARKTGYMPPVGYRSRRKAHTTIVTLVPGFRHTFFDDVIEQLHKQAQIQGKQLVLLPIDNSDPKRTLSMLQLSLPMGVVLLDERAVDPIADTLSRENRAVVVCGGLAMGRRFSAIHIDDMMAAYDGTNYLIELGHQNIGFLSDDYHAISTGFQRITGCRKALEDAHIKVPEENFVCGSGTRFADGYMGMERLLSQAPDITAVFAFSDDMAAGAIAYLQDVQKRVPEDISILGFDDSSIAERLRPKLTTVHQPIAQLAGRSLEYLFRLQRSSEISSLTLPYHLVERDSCCQWPHKK